MAEWKKVVLRGDNVTTELLKATDAEIDVSADSVVFADDGDGSGVLKKERVTDFATKLAGTNTATGLKAASGVIGLDKDTTAIGTLATGDILLAYDIDANVWGTVTANEVGSAGADTNTTYSLSSTTDTNANESTITLTSGGSGSVTTDSVKLSGDADITLTQSGSAPEDISIALDAGLTGVSSIYHTGLKVGRDSHNQIDFSTDNKITIKTNNNNDDAVQLNTTAFQPVNDGHLELGVTGKRWKQGWFDKATVDNVVLDGSTIQHVNFGSDPSQLLTLNGTAAVATKVDTTNVSNDADHHLLFVNSNNGSNQGAETATALTYNPHSDTLTASVFSGNATSATSADTAGTATTANNVKITGADSLDDTLYFLFSDNSSGTSETVYADNSFSWNPQDETLTVTNLKVSGTSTTVNTTDLIVQDKMVVVANGSAAVGDADGAGITVDVGSTEANMPELKWNNNSKLTGWTVSTYDASGNTDYPVAIMTDGDGAPSGTAAGSGSFYVDTNAGNLDLYVYI